MDTSANKSVATPRRIPHLLVLYQGLVDRQKPPPLMNFKRNQKTKIQTKQTENLIVKNWLNIEELKR